MTDLVRPRWPSIARHEHQKALAFSDVDVQSFLMFTQRAMVGIFHVLLPSCPFCRSAINNRSITLFSFHRTARTRWTQRTNRTQRWTWYKWFARFGWATGTERRTWSCGRGRRRLVLTVSEYLSLLRKIIIIGYLRKQLSFPWIQF